MKNLAFSIFIMLLPLVSSGYTINQLTDKPERAASKRELHFEYKNDTLIMLRNMRPDVRPSEETIDRLLDSNGVSPYLKAEYLYNMGLIYLELGGKYHANAAAAFQKSAVVSNELAITNLYVSALMAEEGHTLPPQIDDYIEKSLRDARIFGSEDISGIMKTTGYPVLEIDPAKAGSQARIYKVVAVIALALLVMSGIVLLILYRNYRARRKSCRELRESNIRLADSNRMKETYIKFLLNRNLEYLEEFGRYKKHIVKSLNTDASIEKLKQEVASTFNMDDEYNALLSDFDRSVLELYPCFIDGINNLLKSGQSYATGQGGANKLNTELRILALVRLGITDNKQIASFLRITVQSVYNYRSKARGRAIAEDTFDDDLAGICM